VAGIREKIIPDPDTGSLGKKAPDPESGTLVSNLLLKGRDLLEAVGEQCLGSLRIGTSQIVDAHYQPLAFSFDHVPENTHTDYFK
jgi:hypothetical protein